MKNISIILLISLLITGHKVYSQGCNDAGLCSMGDLDGQGLTAGNKYNTQLSYFFGLGEKEALINTLQFEQRFRFLDDRANLFIQLPFHYIYGNLGSSFGVGDISAGFNYTFIRKKELSASFLIAFKLPPNDANKTIDGKGAPMVYQPSLGVYSYALGANFFYKKWQLGLGYLKPLGSNRNYFDRTEWPDDKDAQAYVQMRDLGRGDDAMVRLTRYFNTKKSRYNVGVLALYRLQKDKITQNNERIALDGSEGLTLNINLGYQKVLKNKDNITFSVAAPVITRKVRVDGLTRTFVVMFTYAFGKKDKGVFKTVKF